MTPEGLLLQGEVVEEGGGFVSCRSPIYSPPKDLSAFIGLKILVDGKGRTLKIALASRDRLSGLTDLFGGGLRWVASIPTRIEGTTNILIPFKNFKPTIRAKKVPLSLEFEPSAIIQFQLLHSKFGEPGELNPGFQAGSIGVLLRSINAYS